MLASREDPIAQYIRSYAHRTSELLSKMENPPNKISPHECFELLRSLGYLRHGTWLADVSPSPDIREPPYGRLLERLNGLVTARGRNIVSCLEDGVIQAITRIDSALGKIEPYLQKGELSSTFTSHEFNAELLDLRDDLGYAQVLLQEMTQPLSPSTAKRLDDSDGRLSAFLDRALAQFRRSQDDPTSEPERFPNSFWWRRRK